MKRKTTIVLMTAAGLALAGCQGADNRTFERTGTSAAVGAATGAVIGSFGGNLGQGAAIGAAVGAAGGYLYDQMQKDRGRY